MRARLFGHNGWIQAITFPRNDDDDGSMLASADDEAVHVWNILTNECLHRLSVRRDLSKTTSNLLSSIVLDSQ